jgi:CspA family cold shock protein
LRLALTGFHQGSAELGCGGHDGRAANVRVARFLETTMASGTVKFFNSQKGFGFIQQTNGGPDVFVHVTAVERAGMTGLVEGQKLSFDIVSERGKSAASNLQAE